METVFMPRALIFCMASSQSDGTGSRKGWNSPAKTMTLSPRIKMDRSSQVTCDEFVHT